MKSLWLVLQAGSNEAHVWGAVGEGELPIQLEIPQGSLIRIDSHGVVWIRKATSVDEEGHWTQVISLFVEEIEQLKGQVGKRAGWERAQVDKPWEVLRSRGEFVKTRFWVEAGMQRVAFTRKLQGSVTYYTFEMPRATFLQATAPGETWHTDFVQTTWHVGRAHLVSCRTWDEAVTYFERIPSHE